jgi:hypothetical protein
MSALAHSEFRTGGEPELRPMKLVVLSQQLDPSVVTGGHTQTLGPVVVDGSLRELRDS